MGPGRGWMGLPGPPQQRITTRDFNGHITRRYYSSLFSIRVCTQFEYDPSLVLVYCIFCMGASCWGVYRNPVEKGTSASMWNGSSDTLLECVAAIRGAVISLSILVVFFLVICNGRSKGLDATPWCLMPFLFHTPFFLWHNNSCYAEIAQLLFFLLSTVPLTIQELFVGSVTKYCTRNCKKVRHLCP